MQQLSRRNTCAPPGASLARRNCDHASNREETLGVHDLKTLDNNPEVNLPPKRARAYSQNETCTREVSPLPYGRGFLHKMKTFVFYIPRLNARALQHAG